MEIPYSDHWSEDWVTARASRLLTLEPICMDLHYTNGCVDDELKSVACPRESRAVSLALVPCMCQTMIKDPYAKCNNSLETLTFRRSDKIM